ncbi:transporter substrate-binding domain-containing protein [Undibacterium sp. RTI2.1]|uniref:substrate-binding periplasmic protein n=1 Tax=unclassified Undibacterium TaxID=2630295 RepID=UPI002B235341|nr:MULTISPECIES: transporter substrate-binding domain-containing protein [unclassified Undibacterium]MEB0032877.1 transporter substrate-binding domain-containing protein [Undibacterium sp. RTI2.1]MEB0118691.1 transporter substrate-binding domain-containing protein [Undibacterium sp. RTI2.2]
MLLTIIGRISKSRNKNPTSTVRNSFVFICGILALLSAPSDISACEKTVRWDDDKPYSSKNAGGVVVGYYVDIVKTALERMGCTAKFVELPRARALAELEAGRLDVLPGALKTEQRDRFALFSRVINRSPNVLFVAKSSLKKYPLKNLEDIIKTDFKLGTQVDVSYSPQFDVLSKNPAFLTHLNPIYNRTNGWKMLHVGRINGVIADEVTGLIELQQLHLSTEIVRSAVIVSDDPAMIAFSNKTIDAAFVSRFNTALESMIADGQYVQIRNRYIPCKTSVQTLGCK